MANDPPSNPQENDVWIDDQAELFYFDGAKWVPYKDLPAARDADEPPSLLR